ncbi:MAG TPA: hypothetical protein VGI78_15400 [Acetobacteraceae bacterium]
MAQGTHPAGTPPLAQMKPTPGVTPEHEVESFTQPVLFDDIDPVRLVRLYGQMQEPGAMAALRAEAMKAGQAAYAAAPDVVASQQVPVSGQEGQEPPPAQSPGVAPPPRPAVPPPAAVGAVWVPQQGQPQPPPAPPGTQWTPEQVAAWQRQQATRPPGA